MKRPATRTLIIGHPFVATPMTLACGAFVLAALVDGNASVLLLTLPVLVAVLGASQQAATYRAWVREWESMDPTGPRRTLRWYRWLGLVVVAVGTLVLMGSGNATLHTIAGGVGMVVGGLAVFVVLWTALNWIVHRRRLRAGAFAVRVVAQPTMPVPSLAGAYRGLPSYCHALLASQQ